MTVRFEELIGRMVVNVMMEASTSLLVLMLRIGEKALAGTSWRCWGDGGCCAFCKMLKISEGRGAGDEADGYLRCRYGSGNFKGRKRIVRGAGKKNVEDSSNECQSECDSD